MNTSTAKGHTRVQVENYNMAWKLYKFDRVPFMTHHPIFGPKFTMGSETNSIWTIAVTKDNSEEEESMGFRLTKEKNNFWEVVKFSVTIKSKAGLSQRCLTDVVSDGSMESSFEYITISNLSPENKDIFESANLTVECSIEYMYHKEEKEVIEPYPEDQVIVEDMGNLFQSKSYWDITLTLKEDDAKFECHKSILSARSYRFNMQLQDLKDDPTLVLNLDKKIAKAMIWYIYTSEMPHRFSKVDYQKLCSAASFYNISHLAKLCQGILRAKGQIHCICPKCKEDPVESADETEEEEEEEEED